MDESVSVMTLGEAIQRFEDVLSDPRRKYGCAQQRMDCTQLLEWLKELSRYRDLFMNMEDDGK